ncbi:hypothetical protein AMTR_s00009p00085250 [Amborella trichopoda]|uniref:NADP-dependent oxidoreductase domain-containing protein n=1 Tax=Amborella trichopoda TaxID=13333 RepID=W1NH76_AMBTC|nr:hypothetical protein AMTR_s00009p00085250 [Amborella trichopoda]
MIELIHHAINSGVTFLNTSDAYGPFPNKILLGKVSSNTPTWIYFGYGELISCGVSGFKASKGRRDRERSWLPSLESALQMGRWRFVGPYTYVGGM